jgi:hypothetical protein
MVEKCSAHFVVPFGGHTVHKSAMRTLLYVRVIGKPRGGAAQSMAENRPATEGSGED